MKFDNIEGECAHAILNHGFAEEEFSSVDEDRAHALVTVSAVLLLNVGEDELALNFSQAYLTKPARAQEIVVHIVEDKAHGFVHTLGIACSDESDWLQHQFEVHPDRCDGCDQDPWRAPKHYGDCPLATRTAVAS